MIRSIFFDSLLILTILVFMLSAALRGAISPSAAAVLTFGMVGLVAISRALKMGVAKLLIRVGMPLIGLLVFLILNTDGSTIQMKRLLGPILLLLIALIGLYIMIRGIPGKRRS
jgi:hypothetical protein